MISRLLRFSLQDTADSRYPSSVQPLKYEENMPYNRNFSYSIFFLSAVTADSGTTDHVLRVSMLTGTMREENRSFAVLPDRLKGHRISRTVMGRVPPTELYIAIGAYGALVPRIFGLPQNCPSESFHPAAVLCDRMRGIPLHLQFADTPQGDSVRIVPIMSPICLFLTGFSWPVSSFRLLEGSSRISSLRLFAVQAFINMNTAGASLSMAAPQIAAPDHTDDRISISCPTYKP